MNWFYLFIAGIFEIAWAVGMKYSDGFTKIVPSVCTVAGMAASFIFLSLALRTLPISTAYAVWTGIGTFGVGIAGFFLFNESCSVLRVLCLIMIAGGIAGLKLLTK